MKVLQECAIHTYMTALQSNIIYPLQISYWLLVRLTSRVPNEQIAISRKLPPINIEIGMDFELATQEHLLFQLEDQEMVFPRNTGRQRIRRTVF